MDYQTPDLAAVLRTLAAYAPPSTIQSGPNQSFTQDPSIPPTGTVSTEDLEEGEWEGRQALVAKQEARKEGKKKLDEVLCVTQHFQSSILKIMLTQGDRRSVGGNIPSSSTVSIHTDVSETPEEDTAELLRYDRKVHRACTEMVEAMSAEFKTFGVPFFGTKDNLIGETGNGFKAAEVDVSREEDGKRILGGKLTTTGLIDLQKRMLELLEDMCQE
ncbi:MAG: hypothetical protein M1827_005791 [Pycnora praestabilis]|nr:MAG: hypothetical protein M1827_005791 [Pycnora praestabilis]